MKRFGVSLPDEVLHDLDHRIVKNSFSNRSQALIHLIKTALSHREWNIKKNDEEKVDNKRRIAASINISYDHHKGDIASKIGSIQHDYHHIIHSTQHIHLNHEMCLEIIICIGKAADIREFYESIKKVKAIKAQSLSVIEIVSNHSHSH